MRKFRKEKRGGRIQSRERERERERETERETERRQRERGKDENNRERTRKMAQIKGGTQFPGLLDGGSKLGFERLKDFWQFTLIMFETKKIC